LPGLPLAQLNASPAEIVARYHEIMGQKGSGWPLLKPELSLFTIHATAASLWPSCLFRRTPLARCRFDLAPETITSE